MESAQAAGRGRLPGAPTAPVGARPPPRSRFPPCQRPTAAATDFAWPSPLCLPTESDCRAPPPPPCVPARCRPAALRRDRGRQRPPLPSPRHPRPPPLPPAAAAPAEATASSNLAATTTATMVRNTSRLDGRKSRSGFRPCTRPEQAISCYSLVQVHGPCREWKRSEDHVVRLGSMCTIIPRTLRPASTSVTLSTLQNVACQMHTLWLRPFVVTTDSIHIRRCEAAAVVDVGSPRRGRRVTEAC